jgi:hypothetical protein
MDNQQPKLSPKEEEQRKEEQALEWLDEMGIGFPKKKAVKPAKDAPKPAEDEVA